MLRVVILCEKDEDILSSTLEADLFAFFFPSSWPFFIVSLRDIGYPPYGDISQETLKAHFDARNLTENIQRFDHFILTDRRLNKVRAKVKLSLCLTEHHAMKAYWGVEV
jgi:hypothetical protein